MRKEKQLLLNEIKEKIDASTSMIITRYEKLAPNASWQLRHKLAKSSSQFEVVRKRVFLKAAEAAGLKFDSGMLKGHVGVIFINQPDAMASTKTVYQFSEENGKIFDVLVGQIDGKMMPAADLEMLSKLPGITEMRANMLGLFISPMSLMLSVLEAVISQPVSTEEQKS